MITSEKYDVATMKSSDPARAGDFRAQARPAASTCVDMLFRNTQRLGGTAGGRLTARPRALCCYLLSQLSAGLQAQEQQQHQRPAVSRPAHRQGGTPRARRAGGAPASSCVFRAATEYRLPGQQLATRCTGGTSAAKVAK